MQELSIYVCGKRALRKRFQLNELDKIWKAGIPGLPAYRRPRSYFFSANAKSFESLMS